MRGRKSRPHVCDHGKMLICHVEGCSACPQTVLHCAVDHTYSTQTQRLPPEPLHILQSQITAEQRMRRMLLSQPERGQTMMF